ncbi:protein of unknown function [Serratia sp. Tan611]|nr:protein of unknown function [Serratia sp. Tan611]
MRPFYLNHVKIETRNILNTNTILVFNRGKKIITLLVTLHTFAIL